MAESDRTSGRNGSIWRQYVNGQTQESLAAEYGLSRERIAQIIRAVRDSIPRQAREEVITESVELLRRLRMEALAVWESAAAPVTAGKDGDVLTDPETGQVVRDHGGRLRALDTVLKVMEREARLLGLDEAQKIDVGAGERAAAERAAEAALSRLVGPDPEETQG